MKSVKFRGDIYPARLYLGSMENYHTYGGCGFFGINIFNSYLGPNHCSGNGYYKVAEYEYDLNLIYETS